MMGSDRLFAAASGPETSERDGNSRPKDSHIVVCPTGDKIVLPAISLCSAPTKLLE